MHSCAAWACACRRLRGAFAAAVRELVSSLADSCKGQFRAAEQRLDQCESDGAALKAELSRRGDELRLSRSGISTLAPQ